VNRSQSKAWDSAYDFQRSPEARAAVTHFLLPPCSAGFLPVPVCAALAGRAGSMSEYTQRAERRRVYFCVICLDNPVDVREGFDTCAACVARTLPEKSRGV